LFGRAPKPDPAELDRQVRSQAELAAGRLPLSARERLASQVFTSALSVGDLAALRSVGYHPVGQAFGTSTVRVSRQQALLQSAPPFSPFGGNRSGYELRGYFEGEIRSRERALRRLQHEARLLGAEGVIGLRVIRSAPIAGMYEYTVIGTAVRRDNTEVDGHPFLTAVIGSDFAALVRSGWLPVTVILSMVRWVTAFAGNHAYPWANNVTARRYPTIELEGLSLLQTKARAQVREQLERQVRAAGATGMLLHQFDATPEHGEGRFDFEVQAFATAIVARSKLTYEVKQRPVARRAITPVVHLNDRVHADA
jgi:uncharacterized protein YbjQ (UPF0145 family)